MIFVFYITYHLYGSPLRRAMGDMSLWKKMKFEKEMVFSNYKD